MTLDKLINRLASLKEKAEAGGGQERNEQQQARGKLIRALEILENEVDINS